MSMTVQIRAVKMLPIKIGIPKSIFKAIAAPINSAKAVAAAAFHAHHKLDKQARPRAGPVRRGPPVPPAARRPPPSRLPHPDR